MTITNTPESNVSVNQLDESLHHLIALLQALEIETSEWRLTMDRLLRKIQLQPEFRRYCRPGCPDYLFVALNKTWQWLSRGGIKQFNLPHDPPGTWNGLLKWLQCPKGYLWYRIKDEQKKEIQSKQEFSLDALIGDDEGVSTWLDRVDEEGRLIGPDHVYPPFYGLDEFIKRLQSEQQQQHSLALEVYVQEDPDGKLLNCRLRKQPDGVNVSQILVLRMCFKDPPDKLKVIARDLGMEDRYPALYDHWTNKVKPLIKKIAEDLNPEKEL